MEGSVWVFSVAVLVFATTLLVHRLIDGQLQIARLPLTWFFGSWLVGLFLLALPLFRYRESFSGETAAYLIAILMFYAVGSISAAFWARRTKFPLSYGPAVVSESSQKALTNRFIVILLSMGAIGTTLLMVNTVRSGGLSLSQRLDSENFAAIRTAFMNTTESHIGILYGPATLMSAIGGLGVVFAFYLKGARDDQFMASKWLFRLAVVILLFNVVIGFIGFGSRMFAVFAVFVGFFGFVEGRWSIGERLIVKRLTAKGFVALCLSVIISLMVLWVAATVFLEKRVQSQDPQSLLYHTHRANFSPFLYGLTRGDSTIQYLMFSVSYLTTPIPTLNFYLDLPSARLPGPFFGEYNFPAVARWLRRLSFIGDPLAWDRARFEIFKPLGDTQFGTNVWSTLVRDLIADFGKTGALVFLALTAFLAQNVFQAQCLSPSVRRAGLLVYLRLLLAFSGLISILFQPQIHWPLYLSMALLVLGRNARQRLPIRNNVGLKPLAAD